MQNNTKVLSIVGIALGACATVLGILGLAFVGLIFGVAGIVISLFAKKNAKAAEQPTKLATIGLIVSAMGVVVCIVALILYFINESEKASLFEGAIDAE